VFTIALSFIFLTLAANFIVDQYLQVMGNLAGGPLGRTITVTCSTNGADVIATGHASLKGWLPAVPTWTFTVEGISVVEQGPA
jgi:hypothetical protein